MDQGMEAWLKLMGQAQTPDISQIWRPMFGQSLDIWTQILKEGASSPDVLAQWKKFMDDSVEAWSKVLGEAMGTEGFAASMGKFLEQYLNAVGPLRKNLQTSNEEFLRTMNLPSRKQVTDLASQIIALESRLERLEEQIEGLLDGLTEIEAFVRRAGASDTTPRP
jgi:polyhydroxyalkanoic acid synthase PhaR subunit